jgi:hypothetical protein
VLRLDAIASIRPFFQYLEHRITNSCDAPFHYASAHYLFSLVRMFDPGRAVTLNTMQADIDALAGQLPGLLALAAGMKAELSNYLTLAATFTTNRGSVDDFTKDVLKFWKVSAMLAVLWCSLSHCHRLPSGPLWRAAHFRTGCAHCACVNTIVCCK